MAYFILEAKLASIEFGISRCNAHGPHWLSDLSQWSSCRGESFCVTLWHYVAHVHNVRSVASRQSVSTILKTVWHWDTVRHWRMLRWSQNRRYLARRIDAQRHHQLANCNGNKLDSYWYRRTRWGFGVKGVMSTVQRFYIYMYTRVESGLPGHMVEVPEG